MGETGRSVIVASGHMLDAPDASEPRFPAMAEPHVRTAIAALLDRWSVGAGSVVITQGAQGTDVIVAELAIERRATSRVMLAKPVEDFIESSVAPAGEHWIDRFRQMLAASEVTVLDGAETTDGSVYARNNERALATALDLADERDAELRAIAVIDLRDRGRPGGTADFVAAAQRRSVPVTTIDPTRAFRYRVAARDQREDAADGPKRLLAIDGGGIRGLISLQILKAMEREIGGGDPEYRLAHTFDYVAGTSTGAIIAAALSHGDRVADIETMYRDLGPRIFRKRMLPGRWRSLYRDSTISDQLKRYFGECTTIGDDECETLLMLVTHRVETDSIWPVTNVSTAKYNDRSRPDCNLAIPIWKLVRGSSAAPVYFPPETIELGEAEGIFQDGGVTPFNNPALLLAAMATSPRYTLGWATGEEQLLVVSVGTGSRPAIERSVGTRNIHLLFHLRTLISTIMNGSSVENDRLCQMLGATRHAPRIDSEFNDDPVDHVQPASPMFTYVRYNASIAERDLAAVPGPPIDARRIAKLDSAKPDDLDALTRVGQQAAHQVDLTHFAGFLP